MRYRFRIALGATVGMAVPFLALASVRAANQNFVPDAAKFPLVAFWWIASLPVAPVAGYGYVTLGFWCAFWCSVGGAIGYVCGVRTTTAGKL